jgi:predicted Zn-dependent protease
LFAARARYELYVNQAPETAQQTLDLAYDRFGENHVLQLVQAEVYIQAEAFDRAEVLLNDLKTGTAPWIRNQAHALLNAMDN